MGQNASKGLTKAAEKVAKRAAETRPPLPSRGPPQPSSSTSSAPTAANPGNFLRGSGIATQDVRDVGQEMYWQHVQQQTTKKSQQLEQHEDEEESARQYEASKSFDNKTLSSTSSQQTGSTTAAMSNEMPDDLLKFIQDIGPAKRTIDKEYTSQRLLQQQNSEELQKEESKRKPIRKRMKMPLMGNDESFTTIKNTYFTADDHDDNGDATTTKDIDFGLNSFDLYSLLSRKDDNNTNTETTVSDYYKTLMSNDNATTDVKDENLTIQRQRLLQHTIQILDVPTLRMDSDNNILGLYPSDVPGPEVKAFHTIPDTKIMLVLKDLDGQQRQHIQLQKDTGSTQRPGPLSATENLLERRRQRKHQELKIQ